MFLNVHAWFQNCAEKVTALLIFFFFLRTSQQITFCELGSYNLVIHVNLNIKNTIYLYFYSSHLIPLYLKYFNSFFFFFVKFIIVKNDRLQEPLREVGLIIIIRHPQTLKFGITLIASIFSL